MKISEYISFARYRLRFSLVDPSNEDAQFVLNDRYLGSAWRGTFGRNFRKTVCATRQPICDDCLLIHSCPYPQIFENRPSQSSKKLRLYSHTPNPYVLEPSDEGFNRSENTLNVGMVLIGSANQHLPYIIHSFLGVAIFGLSSKKIKLKLRDLQSENLKFDDSEGFTHRWHCIYEPSKQNQIRGYSTACPKVPKLPRRVRVNIISPLRLKSNNKLVKTSDFNFRHFFSSLLRRVSLLSYFFCKHSMKVDFKELSMLANDVPIHNQNLIWSDWTRHSSRQKVHLQMGGLVGSFEMLDQDIQRFWEYLWVGQWIHLGKGCTMGLGRYILQTDDISHGEKRKSRLWYPPLTI